MTCIKPMQKYQFTSSIWLSNQCGNSPRAMPTQIAHSIRSFSHFTVNWLCWKIGIRVITTVSTIFENLLLARETIDYGEVSTKFVRQTWTLSFFLRTTNFVCVQSFFLVIRPWTSYAFKSICLSSSCNLKRTLLSFLYFPFMSWNLSNVSLREIPNWAQLPNIVDTCFFFSFYTSGSMHFRIEYSIH